MIWILKEYSTLKFYHTKEWEEEYVCVSDIQFWILGKLCLIFYQSIYLHNLEITHFSSRTLWISPFPIPELKPVLWIHQFFSLGNMVYETFCSFKDAHQVLPSPCSPCVSWLSGLNGIYTGLFRQRDSPCRMKKIKLWIIVYMYASEKV